MTTISHPDGTQYNVFLRDRLVAKLQCRIQSTRLVFEDDYADDPMRDVLGLRFEENLRKSCVANVRLPAWFSNLLPEGKLREWVGLDAGEPIHHEMALLAHLGHDLPGAVRVLSSDEPLPGRHSWSEAEEAISPGESDNQWRFSLAGVGLKFSVLSREDRFTSPGTGERGDWILKTPDLQHAEVPRNEFTMMTLARAVGIEVPEVRLVSRDQFREVPEEVWGNEKFAFAVKRFDRGPSRELIHIEDFAQVRGFYPEKKYAGRFETLANFIYRGRDGHALREFAKRLTFNALIGNGDAHLKNWSLIYRDPRRPTLSPAYDLVSTFVYLGDREETAGLTFNGSKDFGGIRPETLGHLARKLRAECDLPEVSRQIADATVEHLDIVARLLDPAAPEMAKRIISRVRSEAKRFSLGF
jgi:serine/threonine-protein kinase HipA